MSNKTPKERPRRTFGAQPGQSSGCVALGLCPVGQWVWAASKRSVFSLIPHAHRDRMGCYEDFQALVAHSLHLWQIITHRVCVWLF